MFKVGITGGIGSGKSLICEIFKRLGIAIYYADSAAKHLYDKDEKLRSDIIQLFGKKLYANGILNRKLLALIIFSDKDALIAINKAVHPAVERDFNEWVLKQKNTPYILHEAAILFESGFSKLMDKNISVYAPENLRIKRTCLRDNITIEEVKKRITYQLTDEKRNKLADFIIVNNEIEPVLPQVLNIHNTLINIIK